MLRMLKRNPIPSVRVIAVSGLKDNAKLIEIIGTDVDAFLSKPYTAETLLKSLQQTLRSNN
jgi:CheY-like chemotaxis protein